MPGDTLVITSTGDSLQLRDSLDQLHLASLPGQVKGDDATLYLLVPCAVVMVIFVNWLWKKFRQNRANKAAAAALLANYRQYDDWLTEYNGYYKSLTPHMRSRFLERVALFTASKTLTCIDLPTDEKMPLLIGAAAVQISFGLDKYLLDFFDTIYIMQQNYNYGLYNEPFEGHVSSSGIYLSWNNFLQGYADYTDADNVGIHEMAHALAYVNFMAGANSAQDDAFIKRFYDFSAVARPIFNAMQQGEKNLLNPYAATNYNEFWAVAVETFFEQSIQMKISMTGLYNSMCSLLNQDPLLPDKLLHIPETVATGTSNT